MNYVVINAISSKENEINKGNEIYFKNSLVSLASIRDENIDKFLVTNVTNIPDDYKQLFSLFHIKIEYVEFNDFLFSDNIPWKMAYYKLCALYNFCHKHSEYDKIFLVDTDTVFIKPLFDMINDCNEVMLYYLPFSISFSDRKKYIEERDIFSESKSYSQYFGGEFIGGPNDKLKKYLEKCHDIYRKMLSNNFCSIRGDEFIWSLAAESFTIKFANPYIERLWTGRVYLVSTSYFFADVAILHVPGEKETGMIWLYDKIRKKRTIPNNKTIFRALGLPKLHRQYLKITKNHFIVYVKKIFKGGKK